jgi:hypothetical protein
VGTHPLQGHAPNGFWDFHHEGALLADSLKLLQEPTTHANWPHTWSKIVRRFWSWTRFRLSFIFRFRAWNPTLVIFSLEGK